MSPSDAPLDLKRVIVLDDDPAMLRTHERVLRSNGFRPLVFDDPWQAIQEIMGTLPGVIIVDLMMPQMSGVEVVTRLRAELGRECPPVVLVSGNASSLEPMEQIVFDAIFSKPYAVDDFTSVVRRLARRHYDRMCMGSSRRARPQPADAAENGKDSGEGQS
ncbi:MAG: response regulator [Sandaracinaceae bacterium]